MNTTDTERAAAHGYTLTDETQEPVLPTDKPIAGETPRTDAERFNAVPYEEAIRKKGVPPFEYVIVVDAEFAASLERQLAEAKAEIDELRFYKEHRLPADWTKDSSLETWFPYTAQELEKLKSEIQGEEELKAQISALRSQLAAQPLPPPPAAMKGETK